MDYPGLNPSAMSDDELQKKVTDLTKKLVQVHSSVSQGAIQNLQWMLETLQCEQAERLAKQSWQQTIKSSRDVLETDPDLKPVKTETQAETKKKTQSGGGGGMLKRARSSTAGGTTDL